MQNSEVKTYLDRVERLQEEISGLREDIKDLYAEAKGKGYDTKMMKKVLKVRKIGISKHVQESDELDVYLAADGLISSEFVNKKEAE
jgi:uncharacterized protein (UPF0335 family)